MTYGFSELTLGGVLVAAFVPYALGAFFIFLLVIRPLMRVLPIAAIFANPPLVGVCFYVLVLAALIVLF